jgi:ribosomal-protein-alanine N-acetyltransferase
MNSYIYKEGIETVRIKTRWLNENDIEKWTEFLGDKECTRYFPNTDFETTKDRSVFWIGKQLERYKNEKYGLQALIEKKSGEFIGQCGLLAQEVDGVEELEVGYHVFRKYWGRGFAPEIAKAFMNYAQENKLADSIISIIHKDNIPSQRVAIKNGLSEEKTTFWKELPVKIFRLKF